MRKIGGVLPLFSTPLDLSKGAGSIERRRRSGCGMQSRNTMAGGRWCIARAGRCGTGSFTRCLRLSVSPSRFAREEGRWCDPRFAAVEDGGGGGAAEAAVVVADVGEGHAGGSGIYSSARRGPWGSSPDSCSRSLLRPTRAKPCSPSMTAWKTRRALCGHHLGQDHSLHAGVPPK